MFINETNLIKSLKKNKNNIRIQVEENNLYVTNGYYLVHINDTYHKTIAFLQESGYLDSKLNVINGAANVLGISKGIQDDYEAKITSFIIDDDHDMPKNRRINIRIANVNNKIVGYNEEYIQVFAGKFVNEYQLTFKGSEDGYTMGVYYGDTKLGVVLGVRADLDKHIKELAV